MPFICNISSLWYSVPWETWISVISTQSSKPEELTKVENLLGIQPSSSSSQAVNEPNVTVSSGNEECDGAISTIASAQPHHTNREVNGKQEPLSKGNWKNIKLGESAICWL